MHSFKKFLNEEKNLHLEHIEDEVLNNGVDGARQAINFLRGLRDMLAGSTKSGKQVRITVKWDGAPAIFAGTILKMVSFLLVQKVFLQKMLS